MVVNDSRGFRLESFSTVAELLAAMRVNVQEDASAFVFRGEVIHTSGGPWRYLLLDPPQPLFQEPGTDLVPDTSGYLGPDYSDNDEAAEDLPEYYDDDMADFVEEWEDEDEELPE